MIPFKIIGLYLGADSGDMQDLGLWPRNRSQTSHPNYTTVTDIALNVNQHFTPPNQIYGYWLYAPGLYLQLGGVGFI